MRKLVAVVAATAFLFVCWASASALQTTAIVKAPNGTAQVVSPAQKLFQALIDDFTAAGYKVGEIGCKAVGHMHNSKHHWGGACDFFSQYARDKGRNMPPASVQISLAHKHGLVSGCEWRHRDCGHFEVKGPNTPTRNQAYLAALKGTSYKLAADTRAVQVITLAQQAGVDDIDLVMRETKHGRNFAAVSQHSKVSSVHGGSRSHRVGRAHLSRMVRLEAKSKYRHHRFREGDYLTTASSRSSTSKRAETRQAKAHQVFQRPSYEGRYSQEHGS